MKKILLAALFVVSNPMTFAAELIDAKLDDAKENIEVTVRYGGGCKEHVFSLEVTGCFETSPVQCKANLIESTIGGPDFCEAYITATALINLEEAGLKDRYYKKGSLTIYGDKGAEGLQTSATIQLP